MFLRPRIKKRKVVTRRKVGSTNRYVGDVTKKLIMAMRTELNAIKEMVDVVDGA